jgi:hypothetical protein
MKIDLSRLEEPKCGPCGNRPPRSTTCYLVKFGEATPVALCTEHLLEIAHVLQHVVHFTPGWTSERLE